MRPDQWVLACLLVIHFTGLIVTIIIDPADIRGGQQ